MYDKFIAYQGLKFTIEWYFDARGHSQALDYFNDTPEGQQDRIINLFKLIADRGSIINKTKFRNEGDGIYAFKVGQDRYLCFFFKGARIIISNAFKKKSQKLPKNEKEKALIAYNSNRIRFEEDSYA